MTTNQDQVSATYNDLVIEHQHHERRLEELRVKSWLSPDEEIEEKRLKKLKLQLKDRMAQLQRAAS